MTRQEQELLERAASGRLTLEEQQLFERMIQSDLAFGEAWEEEKGLDDLLGRLPNVQLSSNFTAQVVGSIQTAKASRSRPRIPWWRWSWARLLAGSAVAALAVFGGVAHYQSQQRAEMAESLSAISEVATVFSSSEANPVLAAEILQDFDAILRLSSVPSEAEMDFELLIALQR